MTGHILQSSSYVCRVLDNNSNGIIVEKYKPSEPKSLTKVSEFFGLPKVKVNILDIGRVQERLTAKITSVVLITTTGSTSKQTYCYILLIDANNDMVKPLRKLVVERNILKEQHFFKVIDGPAVLIITPCALYLYESVFDDTLVCHKYPVGGASGRRSLLKLLDIYWQPKYKCYRIFLQDTKESFETEVTARTLICSPNAMFDISLEHFIPEEYTSVISTMCIQSLSCKSINESFSSKIVIGTLEGFLVLLRNGEILSCVQIWDVPLQYVNEINYNNGLDQFYIAGARHKYAVLDNKLQPLKEDPQCQNVVKGDFQVSGTEQLLFIYGAVQEGTPCLLWDGIAAGQAAQTDAGQHITSSVTRSKTVVKALTGKLQRERQLLTDELQSVRQTEEFLIDSLHHNLTLADTGVHPPVQSGLLPLVQGDLVGPPANLGDPQDQTALTIARTWQKTYSGKWCIGLDVSCRTPRPVTVWLDVVLEGAHTVSSRVFIGCKASITSSDCPINKHLVQPVDKSEVIEIDSSDDSDIEITFPKPKKVRPSLAASYTSNVQRNIGAFSSCDKTMFLNRNNASPNRNTKFQPNLNTVSDNNVGNVTETNRTLTCVLPVPGFHKESSVRAKLTLNWKVHKTLSHQTSSDQAHGGLYFDGMEQVPGNMALADKIYTKDCGQITLNVTDVLEGKHELNFEDSMMVFGSAGEGDGSCVNHSAWQAVQTRSQLQVCGGAGILQQLDELLEQRCEFEYRQHWDCYVTRQPRLSNVQLRLGERRTDSCRDMDVFYRNDEDLLLLVHFLYSNLPDHVTIVAKETSENEVKVFCAKALQKEAHFVANGLRKLLVDHEAVQASGDRLVDECEIVDMDGDLRKVGEKFKRRQENFLKKQTAVLNQGDEFLQQFSEGMFEAQSVTDQVLCNQLSQL